MRHFRLAAIGLLAALMFAGAAEAQKKPVRKTPAKKPPATTTVVPPLDVRAAREKVDNQLSNVSEFSDKLAAVAQALEMADADGKAGRLKPETAAKIEANKKELVEAIRNIKLGLADLESDFRTKPALQKYLPAIQGITDLAAQSEASATAGHFVAATDPLREASKKLTDTLVALPK